MIEHCQHSLASVI